MGVSLPQYAIRWALNRPVVTSVILGIKNRQQLHENLSLAAKPNVK
jgi:aryl-alcohol dehydrogenase-like predicted oxidoreductase